jgi:hypothetical protein
MNEMSFRTKPHRNAHNTLGVDTGAIGPRWRMDYMEKRGEEKWRNKMI